MVRYELSINGRVVSSLCCFAGLVTNVETPEGVRQRGYAETLLRFVLLQESRPLDLYVYADNKAARQLYGKLGFVAVGTQMRNPQPRGVWWPKLAWHMRYEKEG